MPISENARFAEAIRRKLRALAAVSLDPAATEHEKANARRPKGRLETQVCQDAASKETWTGIMFRLGRSVRRVPGFRDTVEKTIVKQKHSTHSLVARALHIRAPRPCRQGDRVILSQCVN
jgi:hypothetical protein